MDSLGHTWGTEAGERELVFPCDGLIPGADHALFRGVTINTSAEVVFRWLCQMRAAPYSYDWLDNGGRRSPGELTPGLENLAEGQTVMRIFDLVGFATNQHLTLRLKPHRPSTGLFGDIAVSYMIVSLSSLSCRLLVKLVVKYPSGLRGQMTRLVLPWGDLVMMRRQLLNFKALAESTGTPLGKTIV